MSVYDEKNKELHTILQAQRTMSADEWSLALGSWCDSRIISVNENKRNLSGSLLQPYLAAMKISSSEAMDAFITRGFDPTYEILHKHQTILAEYLSTSISMDSGIVKKHLEHVQNFYSDYPESLKAAKLMDYVNQNEPYLKQDSITHLVKRNHASSPETFGRNQRVLNECAKLLLAYGAKLNRTDRNNYTALHWAIIEGNSRVAVSLIRQMDMASLTTYNSSGQTAMSLAASSGMKDVVQALLRQRVAPDGYSERNRPPSTIPSSMMGKISTNNPLLRSLQGGHAKLAYDLVVNGGSFSGASNPHDMHTALIMAVKLRDLGLLELMLKKGFVPNEANNHGFTPLLYAVSNLARKIEMAENYDIEERMCALLVGHEASVDTMSKNGLSAISVIESVAQVGNGTAQDILFKRNTSKLFKFIYDTSGVQVQKIADLGISDDQMADMRLARIENINSVWLNKSDKSLAYKESLMESGFTHLKKLVAFPVGVSSGVFASIQAIDKASSTIPSLKGYELIEMATTNVELVTAAFAVLAGGAYAYSVMKDSAKKYALGYWISNMCSRIVDAVIDPICKRLSTFKDSKLLSLMNRMEGVRNRMVVIKDRFNIAIRALKGDMDHPSTINRGEEQQPAMSSNVSPMPARRAENDPGVGLGG